MRFPTLFLAAALIASAGQAAPKVTHEAPVSNRSLIRLAPDFSFPGAGKARSVRGLHGQPVILLITNSPKTKAFRKELALLPSLYTELANRQAIFVAAFTKEGEGPVQSNIPFVVANNGPAVAAAYGVTGDFAIAVIGLDGNLDYITDKILPASRIRDVVQNSFPIQVQTRR